MRITIKSFTLAGLLFPGLAFAGEISEKQAFNTLQPQTGCPCYLVKDAETDKQVASVGLTPIGPDYPGGPGDYINPGEQLVPIEPIDPCLPYPILLPEPEAESAQLEAYVEPIYIGGVMYKLTKADFTPVYRIDYIYRPCSIPEPVWVLTGYKTTIPVDGDYGQELNFEISGRSDGTEMALRASCGDFSATDSGSKYFISKTMTTNQTCQNMQLNFTFDGGIDEPVPASMSDALMQASSGPSLIELNVIIAEAF